MENDEESEHGDRNDRYDGDHPSRSVPACVRVPGRAERVSHIELLLIALRTVSRQSVDVKSRRR